jgi:hypothetical protein
MKVILCQDCGKIVATRFALHQCKTTSGYRNDLHRLMAQPKSFFQSKPKPSAKSSWKNGDIFFRPINPGKLWRVHRVKGRTVWFLANHYGDNPPRGILLKSSETKAWIKVEREYK